MRRFWQVDFHPLEPPTQVLMRTAQFAARFEGLERLTKCGTLVTMAYSQALRSGEPVEAKTSWGRFMLREDARPFDPHDEPATASL